jgi:YidC/Oxa1 family membrane protein insertase
MDKKSVLAIVLITIVILLLPAYYKLIYNEPTVTSQVPVPLEEKKFLVDTAETQSQVSIPSEPRETADQFTNEEKRTDTEQEIDAASEERFVEIETPLIKAKISNKSGGKILFYFLKQYHNWDQTPVSMINESLQNGLDISFLSAQGLKVRLNQYYFYSDDEYQTKRILKSDETFYKSYYLNYNGIKIEKRITFYGNQYHVDIQFIVSKPEGIFLNNEYQLTWENGLPSNEENKVEDYSYSEIYTSMADEIESFSITAEGEVKEKSLTGLSAWTAIRTKYFLAAIIPVNVKTASVTFGGKGVSINKIIERQYNASMNIIKGKDTQIDSFMIYLGPLDQTILSDYKIGLHKLVLSHGWYERTFRVISLPIVSLLKFMYLFIPNYGVVIIIFSILIKILVYPLTKKSYRSMKEMSKLQPLLLELKEKYKGDPQRYQKETMKLYKEHGVNPMGGCLPILLQLPLLAALFTVFRSTIQLRGASFIPGWIDDLSRADTVFILPFSLPFYGNQFNVLPVLMTVSMIIQSKMTIQDPKQKAMIYIMPIFMLFLFNQFPSGLNLYYTLFNVWTILQQKFIDNRG